MISRSTSHCLWCLISHPNQGSCLNVNASSHLLSVTRCRYFQWHSSFSQSFKMLNLISSEIRGTSPFSKLTKRCSRKTPSTRKVMDQNLPMDLKVLKLAQNQNHHHYPFWLELMIQEWVRLDIIMGYKREATKVILKAFDLDRTCVCSCHVSPSDQEFNLQSRKGPSPGLGGNNNVESSNVRPSSPNYATTAPRRHARQPKVRSSLIQYSIAAQTNKRKKVFNK